jgi:hypothetical protein
MAEGKPMRSNRAEGLITLSATETAKWRKARTGAARGRDFGWCWAMRAELTEVARRMMRAGGRTIIRVALADGELAMAVTYDTAWAFPRCNDCPAALQNHEPVGVAR